MESIMKSLPDDMKQILGEIHQSMARALDKPPGYDGPEWMGYRFPQMFNSDTAQRFYEDFEFKENAVILSTFPKTGSNWIGEILRELACGHDEKLNGIAKSFPLAMFIIEMGPASKMKLLDCLPLPRQLLMTHLPAPLLNHEKLKRNRAKVIVPIRNPKDQAISWYHFSKGPHFDGMREHLKPEWSDFFLDFIAGNQPIPVTKPGEGYAEFLRGWYEHKDDGNVLFVHFENLKKDPKAEIQRIARFLEIETTDEFLSKVIHETSFETMKRKQNEGTDNASKIRKEMNLVRKGKVGSWKDTFTVAQSEMMDDMMTEKLKGIDIKFAY